MAVIIDGTTGIATPGETNTGNLSVAGSTTLTTPLPIASGGTGASSLSGIAVGNLAGGSAGTIPYQSTVGTTAMLATGTSGQALLSAGSSAAPAWGNLPVANISATGTPSSSTYLRGDGTWNTPPAGAYILLATITASNSATVSFNSTYITSTYDKYIIECIDVVPATNNVQFYLGPSANNGSTFPYSFNWASNDSLSGVGPLTGTGGGGAGQVFISGNSTYSATSNNLYNGTGGYNGTITLYKPSSSGIYKSIMWQSVFTIQTGSSSLFTAGAAQTQSGSGSSTTAYNYVKLYMSSGNISSGTFRLYGIANS